MVMERVHQYQRLISSKLVRQVHVEDEYPVGGGGAATVEADKPGK